MKLTFWRKKKEPEKESVPQQQDPHTQRIEDIKKKWKNKTTAPPGVLENSSAAPEKTGVENRQQESPSPVTDTTKEETTQTSEQQEKESREEEKEKERLQKKIEMKTQDTAPEKESRSDYDVTYEHDKKERKTFRLKIIYNKKGCIAAGHCVLSDFVNFKLDKEFKADLVDGKEMPGPVKGVYEKEIETDEPHLIINAAKTCTPKVIGIIDLETGKRIAP